MHENIEILDVTLRDGEQTRGVSFNAQEKLNLTKFLLENLKVTRVEVASARVSRGELESVKSIMNWGKSSGYLDKIEILGFVDGTRTVDWINESGGRVLNLLTKGSERHLKLQLNRTPEEHLSDIHNVINYATAKGIRVNIYLEDWSNGMLGSREYVQKMIYNYTKLNIGKIFLPDTLGVLSPDETHDFIKHFTSLYPDVHFEFHGHNDYDLAVANCLAAVKAGVRGVHVSVNGLGERAGNSPLEAVVTALHDKLKIKTTIVESQITQASRLVEAFSGKRISDNRPIVGQDVFTQTAGVHADGDKKANLYANPILPERFGRKRSYALGKLAGRASVSENLKELGMELDAELEKKVLEKVIEMGDSGIPITKEDLPFLVADLSGQNNEKIFIIESCVITTGKGIPPSASLIIKYRGDNYKETGTGDGGYDSFMIALKKITEKLEKQIPSLIDYQVRIPPGGKSSALVETVITWDPEVDGKEDKTFRTIGLHPDQVVSAILATEKMLNLIFRT